MSIAEVAERHVSKARSASPEEILPVEAAATDDELLRQFVADRDEMAFACLVNRHASLVMGVCRRALGNEQDAEDAFQATFLVLARKAGRVRRGKSLSAWLYKTAYRIALRARARRSRRKEQPLETETMIATETFSQIASEHQQSVLDEELNRLPEKYRLPLFLCCVEGKPREEAARQLGVSPGSLKGRLERGRQLLRQRLMLRGVALTVGFGFVTGWQPAAQAAQSVAPSLIASTVQAGVQYASGKSPLGWVSSNVLSLANGSLQIMSWTTSKLVVGCLLGIGALAAVGNGLPAPASAGADEGKSILLTVLSDEAGAQERVVQLAAADERDGQRRSPEAEAGPRRSPEAEAGPRRSPEAEAGPRRSPEAEAGPRRSPEAEAGPRRSPERDRDPRRSPEGEGRREGNPFGDFRPQTQREAALYQMILQLQREVAHLREAVGQRPEGAFGEARRQGDRPYAESANLTAGWERSEAGRIFRAYDKNRDQFVSLEEWLAMTNGNINPARRELQTKRFRETDPGEDEKLSPAEFIEWWKSREGAQRSGRDGEGERGRSVEGERDRRRSAEEEGPRRSPEADAEPRRSPERDRDVPRSPGEGESSPEDRD